MGSEYHENVRGRWYRMCVAVGVHALRHAWLRLGGCLHERATDARRRGPGLQAELAACGA